MNVSLSHLVVGQEPPAVQRKPSWLKMKMPHGEEYSKLLNLVSGHHLHTVCQSAKCPNMGECWAAGTATLMILGDVCTRSCGFCNIATGRPPSLDLDEPKRVGDAVARMIPEVLGSSESHNEESIYSGLLEYPQYTKPRQYEGMDVPEVLISGNHTLIHLWQFEKSLELTKERRPDLWENFLKKESMLTKDEKKILKKIIDQNGCI
jgi:hypothetical protein